MSSRITPGQMFLAYEQGVAQSSERTALKILVICFPCGSIQTGLQSRPVWMDLT